MAEKDRTTEILSGFRDHRSTLWYDFKNLIKKGAISYVDFVNGKTDEAKAAFQREGVKVEEKDFADLAADARKAFVQGSPSTEDPNAVTQFSSAADFGMARGSGAPGNSASNEAVKPTPEPPPPRDLDVAGSDLGITDTAPSFMQEEPAESKEKVFFEHSPEPTEKDDALGYVQKQLFAIDGGKYLPEGEDPNGDGYFGNNTKSAVVQFFADRGIKTDGTRLTEKQVDMILQEAGNAR